MKKIILSISNDNTIRYIKIFIKEYKKVVLFFKKKLYNALEIINIFLNEEIKGWCDMVRKFWNSTTFLKCK